MSCSTLLIAPAHFSTPSVPAGVRLMLDATLLQVASKHPPVSAQLSALLDALAAVKQLLPSTSPCGAYVSQHMANLYCSLLQQWLHSGLLLPLGQETSGATGAKAYSSSTQQAQQVGKLFVGLSLNE